MPPLVVDDEEAMALAVAIQTHLATGDGGDAALRALTKIIQVVPRRLRARLDAVRSSTTPAPWSTDTAAPVDHTVLSTPRWAAVTPNGSGSAIKRPRAAVSRRVESYQLVPLGRR